MTDRIAKRFAELEEMANRVAETKTKQNVVHPSRVQNMFEPTRYSQTTCDVVRFDLLTTWITSVQALLERVFGRESTTFERFKLESEQDYASQHDWFDVLFSIFLSAKDQYTGGHLFNIRSLVHADVFGDELEQADHFLDSGYKVPAAVIAGTVLESTLRELCSQHNQMEPVPKKLDAMNSELAKLGVYNKMRADQVRAWAKVRNSAAHGLPDDFEENDVKRMIEGIRDFIASVM
ncbi:DUF4145 domain-containing protein [Thalassoglobus sp. JC818]|uniref:DUF4145 domain-containing protein n=1 Tax=Thalassoglobus sp. JC818 TaxID=3232136 RepID=UPI00345971EC